MAQPLVKKDDDRDDEAEYSPFLGIEKGAVLQEARVFNDPQLDPRRCSQVITKLLYLLNQGETFTKIEATEVFFAVTKLFQSRDIGLRRMVYLMIKELSPSADEVIIDSVIFMNLKDIGASTVSCYSGNKNHFFSWILFCLLPKFLGTPIAYVPFFFIKVVDRSPSSAFVLDNSGET